MERRRSTKRKQPDETESNPSIQTNFQDLMDSSFYDWIDPHDCVPFTSTRPVSRSGVLRLMDIFDGAFNGQSINGGGIACGTDTPIVVKLTGTHLTHVGEYFRKKGYPEDEIKGRVQSRKQWYGIVDGEHSFLAIIGLIEKKKRWANYKWFVTVINSGFDIERYRQLARMQNERHSCRFHVELTFFDMISNMKTEYEKLRKVQKRVVGQDVVDAYCGYAVTSKKNSTLVQTANTAIRLPSKVITIIGEVTNAEHPELILSNTKFNDGSVTSTDEAMRQFDCRVFRNLLHLTSLKSAKAFMNAKHVKGEKAQVYTIYRVQDLYKQRSFSRSIQANEVGRQYELALYSIEEEEKFLKFISPDEWPKEMNTIRQNLLQTVQLSEEVLLNHGNKEVLPCLLTAYKRHVPEKFNIKQKQAELTNNMKQKTCTGKNTDADNEAAPGPELDSDVDIFVDNSSNKTSEGKEADVSTVEKVGTNHNDKEKEKESLGSRLDSLKEKGINCHNMKWEDFFAEVWSSKNKSLDAIITEPPSSPSLSFIHKPNKTKGTSTSSDEELSKSDIMDLVKAGKRILKPGGYFIVIIEFDLFQEWYLSFKANGFNIMRRPLTFSYKQNYVPRRPSEDQDFPYGLEEYCFIPRLPGKHPDGFNPDFKSNYNLIECNWTKRAPIITNVDQPTNKLCFPKSRKPVRVSEKSVNVLAEIIDLYVPPYGTVIDLFAGTMTLPIASLKTSRRCIAVEKDRQCFELAIARLADLCSPVFKFVVNHNSEKQVTTNISKSLYESKSTEGTYIECSSATESAHKSMNQCSHNIIPSAMEETSRDVDQVSGLTPKIDCTATGNLSNVEKSDTRSMKYPSLSLTSSLRSLKPTKDLEASETLLLLTNNQK